ncbi:hypothetical protein ACW7GZ_14565 [Luteimonas sp. A537]
MKIIRVLVASAIVFFLLGGLARHVDASDPPVIEARTQSADGKGSPNGSSADEKYLSWLVPTQDQGYGYTKTKPVQIGGFLEGAGHSWSGQYFASLLGLGGEPTHFERVGSCCGFTLADERFVAKGLKVGFLDVYDVVIGDSPPVKIYVSLYGEERIHAPAGFTTRGAGP